MYKPRKTEARERFNAYQRAYRQSNPEKVRRWRDRATLNKAARLQAEAQQAAEAAPDAQGGGQQRPGEDGQQGGPAAPI